MLKANKGSNFHEKSQQIYLSFILNLSQDSVCYNVECCLSNPQTGESRTVSHINYITWPDHGVPKVQCTN